MIFKIAWRNIWRNKIRSLVVIVAISVGLLAGVFASAFVVGMMNQRMDTVVMMEMSDFQFHHTSFREDLDIKFLMDEDESLLSQLKLDKHVVGVSERVISMPMMMSPRYSGSIKVTGINGEDESRTTDIHRYMKEGDYIDSTSRNKILISAKVAELYKLDLRNSIVLRAQNLRGEIVDYRFRVCGIYETSNPMFDERNVFVRKEDLQVMLGLGNQIHEIAVLLDDHALAESYSIEFQEKKKNLEVLCWKDLSTGARFMVEAMDTYTYFIVGIIMVALLFSIVNTMLMAVLERIREIGMLMAVGMSRKRVFSMIMLETIFLSLIGGAIGLTISWGLIAYFGKHGINLDGAAYGDMGFADIIYPILPFQSYIDVTIMVLIMAIIGAIYPARKALKMKPVEAIRKI